MERPRVKPPKNLKKIVKADLIKKSKNVCASLSKSYPTIKLQRLFAEYNFEKASYTKKEQISVCVWINFSK